MKRPIIIPIWLRWVLLIVAVLVGLFALTYVVIVGPLFYSCVVHGDCV